MGHTISPIPTHRPPTRSHCSRQVMSWSPSPQIHPHTSRCSPTRDVHTNNRNDVSLMSVHLPGGRAGLNICANESLDSVRTRGLACAGALVPADNSALGHSCAANSRSLQTSTQAASLQLMLPISYPLQTRSIQYSTSANSLIIFVLCVLSPS